jgi:hypothetical protein
MRGMRSAFTAAVVKSIGVVLHSIDFISTGFSKFDCRKRDFFRVWTYLSIDL